LKNSFRANPTANSSNSAKNQTSLKTNSRACQSKNTNIVAGASTVKTGISQNEEEIQNQEDNKNSVSEAAGINSGNNSDGAPAGTN